MHLRPRSFALAAVVAVLCGGAARGEAPVVGEAPNLYGQTGVLRTTSARVPEHLSVDVAAGAFASVAPDFIVPGDDDFDAFVGGQLAASTALFELVELSLAARAASNSNVARGPSQFSVGDLFPSVKLGVTFLPVAVGLDVRGHLPTRVDAAGWDLGNTSFTTQGLVTLDLQEKHDIPVRAHLNGGYVFEGGKYVQGDDGFFEDNPNFYNGIDGQLLALAADQWFYDQLVFGLGVEVPLPWVMPFVETHYRAAVGVPDNRGAGGAPYDYVGDAHLIVTPGARVSLAEGFTLDAAVDLGVLGNGGGATDAAKLVDGTPLNPVWAARAGVSWTFSPLGGEGPRRGAGGDVAGRVVDEAGAPVANAVVTGPTLGAARVSTGTDGDFLVRSVPLGPTTFTVTRAGFASKQVPVDVAAGAASPLTITLQRQGADGEGAAHIAGYVTNREDETVDADIEVWDGGGMRAAGRSAGGAFDVAVAPGAISLVAKADGYLADGTTLVVGDGERRRARIVLQKAPKASKATLESDRIVTQTRVPFEFKKPRLQSTASYVLDDVVDVLLRNPALRLRVEVHSEPLATPEDSQRLADDRAAEVVEYLVGHGVARTRLEPKGIPLAADNDADKSRRVDLFIVR